MPNQQVMQQWYEDLLSGAYSQTKRTLQRVSPGDPDLDAGDVGFCCLGVLCDQAVKAGVIPDPSIYDEPLGGGHVMDYGGGDPETEDGAGTAFLPPKVQEWAGLTDRNPWVTYVTPDFHDDDEVHTRSANLSDLNDEEGLSFAEIAELVKDNFIVKPNAGQPAKG